MSSGSRRLEDLRREAAAAALGLQGGERTLVAALEAFQAENERVAGTYHSMVRSLALALEARDGYTGEHSDAVERLAVAVAARLGLDRAQIADVQSAALLHGIGKIGVPDRVLHKPGRLDEDEWALVHEHPAIGERILRPLPGFDSVATAVRHAHESWDGHGYPDGLAGEAIPLASRIVLACDAWHALGSDRPYRAALPDAEARAELERCAGSQFDPRVVEALLACLDAPDAAEPALALPGEGADTDVLQRLGRELRVLMSLSSAVAATNSLLDLLDLAAEEARDALGAMSVSVSRWEAQAEVLRTTVNVGVLGAGRGAPPERRDLPAHGRRPAQAAAARGPLLHRQSSTTPSCTRPSGCCSSGSAGARAWPCRSCSATSPGASCGRAAGPTSPTSTSTTCACSTRSPGRSRPASAAPSCSGAWPSSRSRTG